MILADRRGFERPIHAAQENALDHPVGDPGSQRQQAETDQGVEPRVALKPFQGCGELLFHNAPQLLRWIAAYFWNRESGVICFLCGGSGNAAGRTLANGSFIRLCDFS
ncbi:hypothetical protein D9M68_961220 [compost metagenome]